MGECAGEVVRIGGGEVGRASSGLHWCLLFPRLIVMLHVCDCGGEDDDGGRRCCCSELFGQVTKVGLGIKEGVLCFVPVFSLLYWWITVVVWNLFAK